MWYIKAIVACSLVVHSTSYVGPYMSYTEKQFKTEQVPTTRFTDVAGCDFAISQLQDVVQYLKNSTEFKAMGARMPRGVLLHSSPGLGKTLLARAVAGEAGCPFLQESGSSFHEVYVGVGAARVRKLFSTARSKAPCIIFIDEIEMLCLKRTDADNAHTEHDSTLNQLLTEMDGFKECGNVVVIGATNRMDKIDAAILRPGRFDKKIALMKPDNKARVDLLRIHTRTKPLSDDFNIEDWTGLTRSMTGAEIEGFLNEAALNAVRTKSSCIERKHLMTAWETAKIGYRTGHEYAEATKRVVAAHEAGHAVVCHRLDHGELYKLICAQHSTGSAGATIMISNMAEEDIYMKKDLLNHIKVLLAGRAAEETINEDISTGAASDIQQATKVAQMYLQNFSVGEDGAHESVQSLLDRLYQETLTLLRDNIYLLKHLAYTLQYKDELDKEEILDIVNRQTYRTT